MFTRTEAIEFAFENGLQRANFVFSSKGRIVVYYWEGQTTDLTYSSGPDELDDGRLTEVLTGRGDGWFVSANTDGAWFWYFDSETKVPHKEAATITA